MNSIEDKSDKKYQTYKRKIREIEEENDQMTIQLAKARHHIKRLRIERVILLEEIDDLKQVRRLKKVPMYESDSEMSISESVLSEPKARKNAMQPKKKRDPNAPKGPGNVFFLYCRMERDNIKDEVPNESLGEVTRLLGQKWKALTKEEKQKYYDIYKKEMEEYETAMKSYTAAGGGAEGAAAVQAQKQDITKQDEDIEYDEDEVDMLQEEDEDDLQSNPPTEDLVAEDLSTEIPVTDNLV
ncbi:high mobility group box domain-containing protein [Sporodiniella umbellata]|nr:high mobility group box domain-containing protein [Sporodiniella umbellata]